MPYLLNAWYVAALSDEVTAHAPFARVLLGRPIVMYRDAAGCAVVLDDRCPHRFAPLSRGRVVNGVLECGYHGLRFDGTGRCVFNPHGDGRVPPRAQVRGYPVEERYGAIWFWPGDPPLAAHTPLPVCDYLDARHNFTSERYLHTRANYQLSADNLLDLSHLQYLHPDTLGSDRMATGLVRASVAGNTVTVHREIKGERLSPMLVQSFNLLCVDRADRDLDVQWTPPGHVTIVVRVCESGFPETALTAPSAHWLTPETMASTHYFFAFGLPRAMGVHGAELVKRTAQSLLAPFRDEDLPMLEAQQHALDMAAEAGEGDFEALRPALLSIDAGAVHARRILSRLIAGEQAQRQATSQPDTCC
jgi:phenylpropionate dioxygenase-like ring-hydroxylating dioxygenase large terminal subunit